MALPRADLPDLDGPRDDLSVSVIVPTYNRRNLLARLLSGLEQQHRAGARFEVIVVVDGSNDGTDTMLSARSTAYPLRAICQARRGPGAARNAGMAAATGDVLLFLDDDVLPQDGLFEGHLAIHRRDPAAAVVGIICAPPKSAPPVWLEWEAIILKRHYSQMLAGQAIPGWGWFYTANASVRREHAIAVGGFDERFIRSEDAEFAYRLGADGLRFHFASDAVVHHEPDRTLEAWLRVASDYGRHHPLLEQRFAATGMRFMQDDWRRRHPLNRLLARWCVGHVRRIRLVVGALKRAVSCPLPGSRAVRLLLCSALFNLVYWEGVAEATGFGPALWRRFIDRPVSSSSPQGH